jgi:hypothetical protein
MSRPCTVLINRSSHKVMVLDNFKVRYNRMRKRIADWVNLLRTYPDIKYVMITLTYAPEHNWEVNHIRTFMKSIRKVLGEKLLGYARVAERQRRGAIHYHVLLAVPNDLTIGDELPYADEAGLWPYGFSRTEIARTPYYLITYLGKEYQKDFSKFPKGIRVFAVYIRDAKPKEILRYYSLKPFQQAVVLEFGWSELESMTRLRKSIHDEENLGWEIWSFESDDEPAIEQAEGWQKLGYDWKGRRMFVPEGQ